MNKPKGKIPSLLSGKKPKRIILKRATRCKRCKVKLSTSDPCFGIPDIRIKFLTSYNKFCKSCFDNILTQTQQDLDTARNL